MRKFSSTITNRELEMGRTPLVDLGSPATPWYIALFTNAWFQVLLISFICFCCPGMYNALSGLGGSGQVDPTVAANANVALLAANAATALFVVGPIFSIIGPRSCWLVGGWTYALYSGSLLAFNYIENGPFVIVAGGVLGVGASFLWVAQGAIMTTYVPESQKGRAIALFWIIFNMGGTIGSLASFGLNYNNPEGTVSNSTYIATMAVMAFGWAIGVFICPPSRVELSQLREAEYMIRDRSLPALGKLIFSTIFRVKILCSLPLFFCANVFYSYQQNDVNGKTFNIRSRSLNSALYWMAQMCGGLLMGFLMDLRFMNRRQRAWLGWVVLMLSGLGTWGGGYVFQRWQDERTAVGLVQDIDFTSSDISIGPMFLYIFYGLYDALWQGYCYWLIGSMSNSAAVTAILVGAYKSFQATGGAMAWRVNALKTPSMTQLAMNWGLCVGALIIAIPTVSSVTLTNIVRPETSQEDKRSMKLEEWEGDMKGRS
ncbi:hypothetical protein RJZ56_005275 [Blastomyces dermatitidis]|uniref:MFS transporter n=6 Tax=Blastomyces TaxID=229219 RepID=A0A179UC26_BLAGS|nr:MFS transporter [Blastomyces gilchristii SLH14081]XP_045280596.1 MFS transporter [Blastomyces dermatitidis ER-3]EGE77180.2 MFS transporter [Blastomyces dermatitidis ATCC 18188]EQL38759.1 hypothetical protein BDFG_00298 [Blastomyces dermatitidis ATCC 26199]OAT00869.1 MFS transporter [Blastomyces dermatitidis ER-3]OAT05380.1 MFS transporter [Blastomyces gilchristii SLH14081]